MAVFRVEKTRDYTVMANHHLRNTELSLKAKGLLSLMLSLPEEWDYTTKGLSCICKDGVDSICAGVRELEEHGYVVRGDNCFYKEYVSKDRVLGVLYKVLKDGKKERKVAGGTFPVRFWRWLYPLRWLWRKMRSAASKGKRKLFGPKG